jgi:hypothetical protein
MSLAVYQACHLEPKDSKQKQVKQLQQHVVFQMKKTQVNEVIPFDKFKTISQNKHWK